MRGGGDQRIFRLKLAIEADGQLSHGAARLGQRVCSHVYNNWRTIIADQPFALPWTLGSQLCFGMSKAEVYNCWRELIDRGYFKHDGVRGCPGKAHFRLIFASHSSPQAKTPSSPQAKTPSSLSTVTARSPQNRPACSPRKATPLNNYFPSEEIKAPMEVIGGGKPPTRNDGGINSSLRSKGTKGNELAASPRKQFSLAEAAARFKAAKKLSQLDEILAEPAPAATVASHAKATTSKAKQLGRKK
jgi:hypothetical protein